MSTHSTFSIGDTVTVPQIGRNRRIMARIEDIREDGTIAVKYLAGVRKGMCGYAYLYQCKRPRTTKKRKEYAFGGTIINQNQEV